MGKEKIAGSVHFRWTAIFCLVAVGFISIGVFYYRYEAQRIKDDKYEALSAIAKVKSDSIRDWRRHRLADVRTVFLGPLLRREIAHLLQDPMNPGARAELQIQLSINRKESVYEDALFLDTRGKILLSDNPNPAPVGQATMKAIEVALKDRKEVLSDFFRAPKGSIYIDVLAPILDNSGQPIAIVVLRSNAEDFLYPFIQAWPTPSRTAETLLVCRDGDSILFQNELRHRSNSALTLRFPLTDTHIPEVQAVLGNYGRSLGRDYRGVDVLAVSQPVPQSPWFIVAKVDMEEILAEVKYRASVIAIIVFLLILISAGVIISVYRKRQKVERNRAEEELRASEEKYRTLVENAGEAIFVAQEGMLKFANAKTEEIIGYTREELTSKSFIEFIHSDDRALVLDRHIKRQQGVEIPSGYSFRVVHRSGDTLWVELNVVVIDWEGKPATLNFLTNITERKLAEEQIKASLEEKKVLLREIHHRVKNNMQVIISLLRLQAEQIGEKRYSDMLKESQDRIKAMALIHERLYQSKDFANINFDEYVESIVNGLFRSHGVNTEQIILRIKVQDVSLDLENAIPCGLIINELVSNSLKHAFPQGRKGEIRISLRSIGMEEIELILGDDGVGIPEDLDIEKTDSLGLHLVSILVEHQLGGEIDLNREGGTEYRILFRRRTDKGRTQNNGKSAHFDSGR